MAKRADKYPLIDPRLPRLYSRILEAANALRASRSIDNSLHHAEVRAKWIESLATLSKKFDREVDLPPENSPRPPQTA
jgi:hypothetical protein